MRVLVLDLTYVGNRGIHLPMFRDVNQNPVTFNATTGAPIVGPKPLAQYGFNSQIEYMEFQGYSNYNSLQSRLEKRFSQGLSTLVSFTWGKTLADAIDQLASGGDATTYQGVKRGPQNATTAAANMVRPTSMWFSASTSPRSGNSPTAVAAISDRPATNS